MEPQTDELVDILQTKICPLDRLEPAVDAHIFDGLEQTFGVVSVVGLGECTHRTREFVQFKHRLVQHLAAKQGLVWLGLEAPPVETGALHRYVVSGTGDLEEILADIGYTIYQTEEMVCFLDWMRSYNECQPRNERIGIFGFDVQSIAGPARWLLDWVEHHAPNQESVSASLSALTGDLYEGGNINLEQLDRAENLLPELRDIVDIPREGNATCDVSDSIITNNTPQGNIRHPLATDTPDELTRQYVLRAFEQAVEFARAYHEADESVSYGLRDEFMAENIGWMLDYSKSSPMAVWAHDNHVKTGRLSGDGYPSETMGEHLRARLGNQYYALGFQFVTGDVRGYVPAADGDVEIEGETLKMDTVEVPHTIDGSIPDLLDGVDIPHGILNLRALPESSPIREWFSGFRLHHYVAGQVDPDDQRAFYREFRTADVFDGLGFVAEVTPTTPR